MHADIHCWMLSAIRQHWVIPELEITDLPLPRLSFSHLFLWDITSILNTFNLLHSDKTELICSSLVLPNLAVKSLELMQMHLFISNRAGDVGSGVPLLL